MDTDSFDIAVHAQAEYLPEQSDPGADRYAFAYVVTIHNRGSNAARLISRHWIISDANGEIEEVRGDGVVGEQPHLAPGEIFEYSSGAILKTPVGTMHGSYQMQADDGTGFDALIPAFTLSKPSALH